MIEPFIENLEDPEVAKSREKYHQIVVELPEVPVQLSKLYPKLAGEEAIILEAVTPIKLIKLSNWSKLYLELALVELIKLSI